MPLFRRSKLKPRSYRENEKVLSLLRPANREARRMIIDARQILLETESILTSENFHCRVLRAKYRLLEESVDDLPLDHHDLRFGRCLPSKKVLALIDYHNKRVKYFDRHFQTYYKEFLKTCVEMLDKDCKSMTVGRKAKGLLKVRTFKTRLDFLNRNVKDLKKTLKRSRSLDNFILFWSDFVKIHDEIKKMAKIFVPEMQESRAEQYLRFLIVPDYDWDSDSSDLDEW